jgi:hypothetical protein
LRNKTSSPSEYPAFLSAKYEVDADRLFYALILAEGGKKSVCGGLSIEWAKPGLHSLWKLRERGECSDSR